MLQNEAKPSSKEIKPVAQVITLVWKQSWLVGWSFVQLVGRLFNQSVGQLAGQSVSQSVSRKIQLNIKYLNFHKNLVEGLRIDMETSSGLAMSNQCCQVII